MQVELEPVKNTRILRESTNYQSLHGLAISADKINLSHCQLSLFVSDNVWKTKKIYINKNCTKPNSWRILGLLFNDGLFSSNNIYLILSFGPTSPEDGDMRPAALLPACLPASLLSQMDNDWSRRTLLSLRQVDQSHHLGLEFWGEGRGWVPLAVAHTGVLLLLGKPLVESGLERGQTLDTR